MPKKNKELPPDFRTEVVKTKRQARLEEKATRWSNKHEWPPRPTDGEKE